MRFVVLMLATLTFAPSQSSSNSKSGCSLLNNSQAAQSISYLNADDSDVRFRLHNNSSCSIVVETDDHEPLRPVAGRFVALHYLLHDRRKQKTVAGYGWGDSVFTVEIAANDSITFMVPLAQLKTRRDIAVPFTYAWEGNDVGAASIGRVKHLVYFLLENLPAQSLRRR